MALKKTKQIKGYSAEYWRVLEYHTNFNRSDAVVVLGLYKDKITRDADENAVLEIVQIDLGSDFHNTQVGNSDTLKNIKVSEIYKHLKSEAQAEVAKEEPNTTLVFFADAVDV